MMPFHTPALGLLPRRRSENGEGVVNRITTPVIRWPIFQFAQYVFHIHDRLGSVVPLLTQARAQNVQCGRSLRFIHHFHGKPLTRTGYEMPIKALFAVKREYDLSA